MPQSGPDPEQLTRRDVQHDDLITGWRGAHHADMAVKQQIKSVNWHPFTENRMTCIEPFRLCQIQNLADLRAGQTAKRRDIGKQAFIQIIQFMHYSIDPAQ